jgi:hypothetical protein
MARFLKLLIVIVIIAAVAGSSAYVVLFTDLTGGGDDGSNKDTTAPVIASITGNTTGATGKSTLIEASFSDNVGVDSASLFYQRVGDSSFTQVNFINGSYSLKIPTGLAVNYKYYVTVDDAAGNAVREPVNNDSYYLITVSQENVSLVHTVFVEEGTAKWCTNCPAVAKIMHELENDSSLHFLYVSLIEDYSTPAHDRLLNDYRIYGYPTLFIDSGYELLMGADTTKDQVIAAIKQAEDRPVPAIKITVSAMFDNITNKSNATITLTNFGAQSYAGTLRVYLNELVSGPTADGSSYHHGFVKFLDIENITAASGKVFTKDLSIDTSGRDVENLEVTAAVFSSSSVKKDSNPANASTVDSDPNNSYNAHFADAANSTAIVPGGNLPPSVGITFPAPYSVNILNKQRNTHLFSHLGLKPKLPIYIGRCTVIAQASDDSKVAKVIFKFDGKEVANFTQAPYQWKMKGLRPYVLIKTHNVTVTAIDDSGKSTSTSVTFRLLRL